MQSAIADVPRANCDHQSPALFLLKLLAGLVWMIIGLKSSKLSLKLKCKSPPISTFDHLIVSDSDICLLSPSAHL
ncbi:hypothetical protein GOBAR_DD09522 [Gossypium barbadense]|nr:hypothetical protein GOBAR_DD09522 [Gossypium barbadense]